MNAFLAPPLITISNFVPLLFFFFFIFLDNFFFQSGSKHIEKWDFTDWKHPNQRVRSEDSQKVGASRTFVRLLEFLWFTVFQGRLIHWYQPLYFHNSQALTKNGRGKRNSLERAASMWRESWNWSKTAPRPICSNQIASQRSIGCT
jgi:hypothetical protein